MRNKGDTFRIYLQFTVNGVRLYDFSLDEIEFSLENNKFYLSKNQIQKDEFKNAYYVDVSQEITFNANSVSKYQIRIKSKEGCITSSQINYISLGEVILKAVL